MRRLDRPYWIWLAAALLFLPWAYVQSQISINGDAVWLTHAAQEFLRGQRMTDAYFDNNPPMSYLAYIPAAGLVAGGVPLWAAPVVFGFVMIALAAVALRRVLADRDGAMIVWASFMVVVTLGAQLSFMQKDHLIALALLPFLMAQTGVRGRGAVIWMVLLTPFIMLKPLYGLLPLAVIVHRAVVERRISVLHDADTLVLVAGCILYLSFSLLAFPDFFTEVLGVSYDTYLSQPMRYIIPSTVGLTLMGVAVLALAGMAPRDHPARGLAVALSALALLSVIPFAVQMKGFSAHMLPTVALMLPAGWLVLAIYVPRLPRGLVLVAVIVAAGYAFFPLRTGYPTHDDYRRADMAALLDRYKVKNGFIMQSDSTNIIAPMTAYKNLPYASRFPSFWFFGANDPAATSRNFGRRMAEDLAVHRPEMVFVYADPVPAADLIAIFRRDPDFVREWRHYRKDGQFTLDFRTFFATTLFEKQPPAVYDIYIRIP